VFKYSNTRQNLSSSVGTGDKKTHFKRKKWT